jgi:hypothetical protein
MRIIGGHDYYDGAGMGIDADVVFVRDNAVVLKPDITFIKEHPFEIPRALDHRAAGRIEVSVSPGLHIIAGRIYPFFRIGKRDWMTWRPEDNVFAYSAGEAFDALSDYEWLPNIEKGFERTEAFKIAAIEEFFAKQEPSRDQLDWILMNRIIVGTLHWHCSRTYFNANHACLKEFSPFRILPPAQIHQEISQFVGGVLSLPDDPLQLSDKSKIMKAGFDTVTSFRKAPGGKRSRKA